MAGSTIACQHCSAQVRPAQFGAHQQRFHVWHQSPKWGCRSCSYLSHSLGDALTHAYLEGHQIQRRQTEGLAVWKTGSSCAYTVEEPMDMQPYTDPFPSHDKVAETSSPAKYSEEQHTEEEKKRMPTELSMHCSKCGSEVVFTKANARVTAALCHVKSCCGIKPYACGQVSSRRSNLQSHIRSKCTTASVVIVDEEKNIALIKTGLQTYFPSISLGWRGNL